MGIPSLAILQVVFLLVVYRRFFESLNIGYKVVRGGNTISRDLWCLCNLICYRGENEGLCIRCALYIVFK